MEIKIYIIVQELLRVMGGKWESYQ